MKPGVAEAAPSPARPKPAAKADGAFKPAGTHARSEASETAAREAERIAEARLRGYEGDACPECGNFTLVRNGTCLKCDTCGSRRGVRRTEPEAPHATSPIGRGRKSEW